MTLRGKVRGRTHSNGEQPVAAQPLLSGLGERVRALRADRGITRRTLAEQSGLSERFMAELEAGRANISVMNLAQIARALHTTPSRLLEGLTEPAARDDRGVIAMLGLRGAGKSAIGRELAKQLGIGFFELDRLVEAEAGMLLPEIFAIHGEEYYRRVELTALKRFLSTTPHAVLATGGGIVMSPDAYKVLLDRTRTVWLRADPEEHWDRVVKQGDLRPMQNRPQAMAELRRRLKEREPLYGKAELAISTSGTTIEAVVRQVVATLTPRG